MKKNLPQDFEDVFEIVRASELSLADEFLRHIPRTIAQRRFKKNLIHSIKLGLPDFRHPIMDPSIDANGKVFFEKGNRPAIGHSPLFLEDAVINFAPQKNSRIGTPELYIGFIGVLIKELVSERRYDVKSAWKAVCDDSRDIAVQRNVFFESPYDYELTGSKPIGRWYDLGNTNKLLKDANQVFWLSSGFTYNNMDLPASALANVRVRDTQIIEQYLYDCPWIVSDV